MTNQTAATNRELRLAKLVAERTAEINTLMGDIRVAVDRTVDGHRADPKNWGFAGNLGRAAEDLRVLASFLKGRAK